MKKNKKWQILPAKPASFNLDGFSELTLQLLFNRKLTNPEEIEVFFGDDLEKYFISPSEFSQMETAIDLIIEHVKAQNKIVVYGDYDADGTTASACLYETLNTLKAKVEVYIPDRKTEGYGINQDSITQLAQDKTKLIITVDCAIKNKPEVAYAKSLGIDVIITDHHPAPEDKQDVPECIILNPKLKDEKYPYKDLAGVGVALKLAKALIDRANIDGHAKELLFLRLLDAAAIGTVADCVPLLGENRLLVKKGLKVLEQTTRPGLLELMKIAKINTDKGLDSWNIGFQIGPRINAAGRMVHAKSAFELLVTKDSNEAQKLAIKLNRQNQERQALTEDVYSELEQEINEKDYILIGLAPENESEIVWEEGVVGLVAGRLTEKHYKPSLVITTNGNVYKGSARSIEEFNIAAALNDCSEYLLKYGGHKQAAGFSLEKKHFKDFSKKIRMLAKEKLSELDLAPSLRIDKEIPFDSVEKDLVVEISQFAPFGQNNPEPLFLSRGVGILDKMEIGSDGRHLKLRLKSDNSNIINALGFSQAEKWQDLKIGDIIDIVYTAEMNYFNGREEVQIKIVDIKLSQL